MRKTMIMLFFLVVVSLCSLSPVLAVINDSTQFQIELIIQHREHATITITEYSSSSPISDIDGTIHRDIGSLTSGTESFEICKIDFTSNIYGLNQIYLRAFPLYLQDGEGHNIVDSRTEYQLDFLNQTDSWSYSLEVSDSTSGTEMTIPITVPFVFHEGVIETVSRSIGVTGIFIDYEEMMAGTHKAVIQVGLEAL